MSKIRLGVNIDHVATVRNARGEFYPSPLRAALLAQKSGAESVTIHLREDRRHIREFDLKEIKSKLKIPLNLEIAATNEMLNIALKSKPDFICIVPEKREELTTEGGLNLNHRKKFLNKLIKKLKKNRFRVSLFIEPSIQDIKKSLKPLQQSLNLLNKEYMTLHAISQVEYRKKYNLLHTLPPKKIHIFQSVYKNIIQIIQASKKNYKQKYIKKIVPHISKKVRFSSNVKVRYI